MEWWWEPLLIKRNASALLIHFLRPGATITPEALEFLDRGERTLWFPQGQVWLHRNAHYAAGVSWGRIHIGSFVPFGPDYLSDPYMTLPVQNNLLPDTVSGIREAGRIGDAEVAVLGLSDGRRCALVCLPHSTLWLSPVPLRALGIQNDKLTGPGRLLRFESGEVNVPALTPMQTFDMSGRWVNINDRLGIVQSGDRFRYTPAGKYNQRSVAVDRLLPVGEWNVVQLLPAIQAASTQEIWKQFAVEWAGAEMRVTVRDGAGGERYRIVAQLGESSVVPVVPGEDARRESPPDGLPAALSSVRVDQIP
jgi:hypothetical protein